MNNNSKTVTEMRAKEAARIVEKILDDFSLDDSLMHGLVYSWLEMITTGDRSLLRIDHTIVARTKFEELLRTRVGWKELKEMRSIDDLVRPRIAMAERCVAIIPNEGRKWMLTTLAGNPDLTIYFHELLRYLTYWKTSLKDIITQDEIRRELLRKLKQIPDMQDWTAEQTQRMLLANKSVAKYLAYMLQTMLETTYLNSISLYRCYIDQSMVHPTLGMEKEKALCLKDGETDCDCSNCLAGISYKQSPIERIEWHRNIVGDAIVQSKVWGGYEDYIAKIHKLDAATFVAIGSKFGEANCITAICGEEFRALKKLHELRTNELQSEISKTEKALANYTSLNTDLKNKLQAHQQERTVAASLDNNTSKTPENNERETARKIKQIHDELDKKTKELAQTKELLTAILSPQDNQTEQKNETISLAEVRAKRGVIIGGHFGLTDKLRRQLPNNIFYSADAKTVDADIIKNSDYVLFLTDYVNHCVSSHALNISREHNIKQGYTNKTNLQLVLEDIARVFAKELSGGK